MARSTSGESVVERVVRILDAFGPETPALQVSQIASRAQLPLSTTSRLVDELVRHGLLRRDAQRMVRIGVRLWELGQRASPTLGLREAALPFMEDLHAVIGHHVQMGVLQNDQVLFVERLSAPSSVINVTRIAGRLSLHASSSGLVLLAHASHSLQEQVLSAPMDRFTAATITTQPALRKELARIRKEGYAFCPGYIHPDATGIAAPIRDSANRVVAALSLVVPNDNNARTHIPALLAAARGVHRVASTSATSSDLPAEGPADLPSDVAGSG